MKWWRGAVAALLKRSVSSSHQNSVRNYQTIEAIPREFTGKRLAAKERKQGRIPAVVLDSDQSDGHSSRKQLITADAKQIQSILKNSPHFLSTLFDLQVRAGPGSGVVLHSGTVLPVKVHRNEENGKILNLVMTWADKGVEMKVDVPVVYKGVDVCPGLKKGGYLQKIRTSLKYLCLTEHIPQKIEVDLTNLDIEDRVTMEDVKVHPSLKLLSKNHTMPICKILATKPIEREANETTAPEATQTSEATKV